MAYLKNKAIAFFRFTLLVLFVSYYSGVTLFYHGHLVDGQVIVHSHPYKPSVDSGNSFQTHAHSRASYILIRQLNQICWENLRYIPQIPDPLVILSAYQSHYKFLFIALSTFPDSCLRAPPALKA